VPWKDVATSNGDAIVDSIFGTVSTVATIPGCGCMANLGSHISHARTDVHAKPPCAHRRHISRSPWTCRTWQPESDLCKRGSCM